MSEIQNSYDAHTLFLVTRKFLYKRAAIAVKTSEDKSKATAIVMAMILAMAFIGGVFGGISIDTQVINPPAQFVGVCTSPAQIIHGGCFIVQTTTDSSGKTSTSYVPSGSVCQASQTVSQCIGK